MKNKYLLLTFLIFAIGFLATQFYFEGQPRTLQTTLIKIDTNQVTSLLIYPAVDNRAEYLLKKEEDFWVVHKKDVTLRIATKNSDAFFKNLATIKTNGVVARNSTDWENFDIDTLNATKIKVFAGKDLLEEFYVNQFDKNKDANLSNSYIRLLTGREVYEVGGSLSQLFSKSFKDYRNTNILTIDKTTIHNINIRQSDKLTILNKNNNIWMQDGLPVDTITLDNYLTGLSTIRSDNFVDDFDLVESKDLLYKILAIENEQTETPIIIYAYLDSTRTLPYIIRSNQNEGSFFASGENGIFEQLFGGW